MGLSCIEAHSQTTRGSTHLHGVGQAVFLIAVTYLGEEVLTQLADREHGGALLDSAMNQGWGQFHFNSIQLRKYTDLPMIFNAFLLGKWGFGICFSV